MVFLQLEQTTAVILILIVQVGKLRLGFTDSRVCDLSQYSSLAISWENLASVRGLGKIILWIFISGVRQ